MLKLKATKKINETLLGKRAKIGNGKEKIIVVSDKPYWNEKISEILVCEKFLKIGGAKWNLSIPSLAWDIDEKEYEKIKKKILMTLKIANVYLQSHDAETKILSEIVDMENDELFELKRILETTEQILDESKEPKFSEIREIAENFIEKMLSDDMKEIYKKIREKIKEIYRQRARKTSHSQIDVKELNFLNATLASIQLYDKHSRWLDTKTGWLLKGYKVKKNAKPIYLFRKYEKNAQSELQMNKIIYNLLKKYSKKFRKAYDPKRAEINRDSLLQIIFEPLRDYLYRIGVTFFGIPKFLNWFVTHGQLEELKQDLDGDIITVYDFESVEKISPDVFYSNEEFSKVDAEVQGISDIDNQRLKILYVAALKMANEYGLKVRNKFMPPGLFGYAHQNRTNVVNILKTDFPAVAFETLIHEITHAILHQNYHPKHPDFENSKIKNLFWFYVFENNEEEMMADYVAALVLNAFGIQRSIDSLVSNSEKVKNWIEKNDKNLEYSKELAEILIKRLKIIRKNLMEENVT